MPLWNRFSPFRNGWMRWNQSNIIKQPNNGLTIYFIPSHKRLPTAFPILLKYQAMTRWRAAAAVPRAAAPLAEAAAEAAGNHRPLLIAIILSSLIRKEGMSYVYRPKRI